MAIDNTKKARRYRLALTDAVSHERLRVLTFTRTSFITAVVSAVVLLLVLLYLLIALTPVRTFIPGYPDARARRQAVQNAMRIDSLETQILQWELYAENLKKVVAGEEPLMLDSLINRQQAFRKEADTAYLAARDSVLRIRVTEAKSAKVSALCVLPEYQRRGIAFTAMKEIEKLHGDIGTWHLSTILEEEGNCKLYEKLGYQRAGETVKVNERMTLVFYEKTIVSNR